jgi:hypothetical protein
MKPMTMVQMMLIERSVRCGRTYNPNLQKRFNQVWRSLRRTLRLENHGQDRRRGFECVQRSCMLIYFAVEKASAIARIL